MAKEGGHTYQEGMCCYRLGNAYEAIQESETAIKVGSVTMVTTRVLHYPHSIIDYIWRSVNISTTMKA